MAWLMGRRRRGEAGMIEIFDSMWAIFMVFSEKSIDIIFLFFFSSAEGLFICRWSTHLLALIISCSIPMNFHIYRSKACWNPWNSHLFLLLQTHHNSIHYTRSESHTRISIDTALPHHFIFSNIWFSIFLNLV